MTARFACSILLMAFLGCGGSSPEEAFQTGLEHAGRGELEAAIAAYDDALVVRPDWVDALVNRGVAWHESGRYGDALADYTRALELDDTDLTAYRNRALTFVATEEYVAAVEDYDAAIRLDPDDVELYGERAEVRRLQEDEDGAAVDLALAELTAAIGADPEDPALWYRRGGAFFEVGEYVLAVADHDEAIRLAPEHAGAFLARAQAEYVLGESDRAITDYARALDLQVVAAGEAHAGRGLAYLGLGDVAKAVADFEAAVRLDPDDEDTAVALAWIYATHPAAHYRDGERAVVLAGREVMRSDERWWRALDVLAAARAELGQFKEARELAQRALELAPDDQRDAVQGRLSLYLADQPFRQR